MMLKNTGSKQVNDVQVLWLHGMLEEGCALSSYVVFRQIPHRKFTKTVHGDSPLKGLSSRSMILLLIIRGNCSHVGAKIAHMVGHLPVSSRILQQEFPNMCYTVREPLFEAFSTVKEVRDARDTAAHPG